MKITSKISERNGFYLSETLVLCETAVETYDLIQKFEENDYADKPVHIILKKIGNMLGRDDLWFIVHLHSKSGSGVALSINFSTKIDKFYADRVPKVDKVLKDYIRNFSIDKYQKEREGL